MNDFVYPNDSGKDRQRPEGTGHCCQREKGLASARCCQSPDMVASAAPGRGKRLEKPDRAADGKSGGREHLLQ